ncbi:MAG TPA: GTPase HflX [Patescibacteria group bacterium]|jgi:GTP-binding protein HflX|nr:GTPase HflX [Patescibacteria group bacterium]
MGNQFKLTDVIQQPKTLIVGVYAPYHTNIDSQGYFDEFLSLVRTNDIDEPLTVFIKLRTIDSGYFLTKGKLEEIREIVQKEMVEQIVISEQLSPQQERNLEDLFNCTIVDRTELILQIFEKSAHTAEGKIQVEMAALKHRKTRLAGKGIRLGQQRGGFGFHSGPGETAKEREMQYIEGLLLKLQRNLDNLHQVRATQRKQRLVNQVKQICLIGYTNAGKSTILNTLTHSNVLAEDKLFATLDTTTRELFLEGKKIGVLSDTVGFIQNLPHQLIAAFKSTLHELQFAQLLLHVIDISNPNWEQHITVTQKTLHELNVDKPMLFVFNKVDCLADVDAIVGKLSLYMPHVCINATIKEGVKPLIDYLLAWHKKQL